MIKFVALGTKYFELKCVVRGDVEPKCFVSAQHSALSSSYSVSNLLSASIVVHNLLLHSIRVMIFPSP